MRPYRHKGIAYAALFLLVLLSPLAYAISLDPEPPGQFNLTENEYFEYDFNSTGDEVSYDSEIPYDSWPLIMDSGTGLYNGTPENRDVGRHNITIRVTNQSSMNFEDKDVIFNISNVNDAPSILEATPGNVTINETDSLQLEINYTDIDPTNDSVFIEWFHNGALVDQTDNTGAAHTSSYTDAYLFETNYSSAGDHGIMVNVSDEHGNYTTHDWSITVENVDRAPKFINRSPVSGVQINETENRTFYANFTDPDGDQMNATWYVNGTPVTSAEEDVSSSNYTFTTNYTDAGTYNISLNVSSNELFNTTSWELEVSDVNAPPRVNFTGLPLMPSGNFINEGENLTVNVSVEDVDSNTDTLQIKKNGSLMQQNISPLGVIPFNWQTGFDDAGVYNISAFVNDTGGLEDTDEFFLEVRENTAPNITGVQVIDETRENETVRFAFNVTDKNANYDEMSVRINGTPLNTNSPDIVNATMMHEHWFNFSSAGIYNVSYHANDTEGLADNYSYMMQVNNTDRAPEFTNVSPSNSSPSYFEPHDVLFEANFSDPDGDVIGNITWLVNESERRFNSSPGDYDNYTFPVNYSSQGNYTVTALIQSKELNATHVWNLTIKDEDRAPNVTGFAPGKSETIEENTSITFTVNLSDPDGHEIEWVHWLENGTLRKNITSIGAAEYSANYTFSTNFTSAGDYNISMRAHSAVSNTTFSFNLSVENVNAPPRIEQVNVQDVIEGDDLVFNATVSDVDKNLHTVRLLRNTTVLNETTPLGNGTHEILYIWETNTSSAGNYTMEVMVNDSKNLSKRYSSNIGVEENIPPNITNVSYPDEVREGGWFFFNATINDSNDNLENVSLYRDGALVERIYPEGAINYSVNVSVTFNESTTTNLSLVVFDRAGINTTKNYSLDIEDNKPPVLQNYTVYDAVAENETMHFSFNATDPNANLDCLSILLNGSVKLEECTANVNATLNGSYRPDFTMAGEWNLTFRVNDTGGFVNQTSRNLTITNTDRAPRVSGRYPENESVVYDVDQTHLFNASYEDPDGEAVEATWFFNGSEREADVEEEDFTEFVYEGSDYTLNTTYNVTLVLNNSLETNVTWGMTLRELNQPPEIHNKSPEADVFEVNESETVSFDVDAWDREDDNLTYEWFLDGTRINTSRKIDLYLNYTMQGNHTVLLEVSDGMLTTTTGWQLQVQNVNREPVYRPVRSLFDYPQFFNGTKERVTVGNNITLAESSGERTYYQNGSFISGVLELPFSVSPAEYELSLNWSAQVPPDTSLTVYVSNGTSPDSLVHWRQLQRLNSTSVTGRFMQVRVNLSAQPSAMRPILQNLTMRAGIADKTFVSLALFNWIDLDDYFYDPDSDMLNYSVQGNDSIEVRIDEDTHRVDLTSEHRSVEGPENIRFMLSDGYTNVSTGNITITVRNPQEEDVDMPEPEPVVRTKTITETITETKTETVVKKEPEEKEEPSYIGLSLITPAEVNVTLNGTAEATFAIRNTWNQTLHNLSIEVDAPVEHTLERNMIPRLEVNRSANVSVSIGSLNEEGSFNLNISVRSTEPKLKDEGSIRISTITRRTESGESIESRLQYVDEMLSANPACQELEGQLAEAREKLAQDKPEEARRMLEDVYAACERMQESTNVSTQEESATDVVRSWEDAYFIIIISIVGGLVLLGVLGKMFTIFQRRRYLQRMQREPEDIEFEDEF